jgi:hypothetical protein
MKLPSPTLHIGPCCNKSLELKMLLHAKEGQLPREASKKEEFGKYFAFRISVVIKLNP